MTQVKVPTVAVPVHAVLTVGVTHDVPLQYREPDTLPAVEQAPPEFGVALAQRLLMQVKAPTVAVPVHAVLTAGVTHDVPLQYREPDTLPAVEHAPPEFGVALAQRLLMQAKAPTVAVPVHAVFIAGVTHDEPLQYKAPATFPAPAQDAPAATVPLPEAQLPLMQVNPATVLVPEHAKPIAGVIHVAPLQ